MFVDLNCDLGESFGSYRRGNDEAVMRSISSANIACGFHAGDPTVMRQTVRLALARGVAIGAHPGFLDLMGFGRREMRLKPQEVEDLVLYQVSALAGIAAAEGGRLQHVKPHGALYNMAAMEIALAEAIARPVAAIDRSLVLFGRSDSRLLEAGRAAGLRVASEVFADRAYEPDGSLVSRSSPGAIVHDPSAVVTRAVQMVRDGRVMTAAGEPVALQADTICVHGDTPGAAELAAALRAGLETAGVEIRPAGSAA